MAALVQNTKGSPSRGGGAVVMNPLTDEYSIAQNFHQKLFMISSESARRGIQICKKKLLSYGQ